MANITELAGAASELRQLNDHIAMMENNLTLLKQKASKLSEHTIPQMMEEIGITEFKLTGDFKVTVRPIFAGKVIGEDGYRWLRYAGHGDMVKAKLEIPYDYTNPDEVNAVRELCKDKGFLCINNASIHHMTMSAFLKEQFENGKEMPPSDKIQVYHGKKTYIK